MRFAGWYYSVVLGPKPAAVIPVAMAQTKLPCTQIDRIRGGKRRRSEPANLHGIARVYVFSGGDIWCTIAERRNVYDERYFFIFFSFWEFLAIGSIRLGIFACRRGNPCETNDCSNDGTAEYGGSQPI